MPRLNRTLLSLAVLVAGAATAGGGLYLPAEGAESPLRFPRDGQGRVLPLPHDQFKLIWSNAIEAGVETPANERYRRYVKQRQELLANGGLSAVEAVSLSGYQLRLRDAVGASGTLRRPEVRGDWRGAANAALAAFAESDSSARDYQEMVVRALKANEPALPAAEAAWLHTVESNLLRLMQLRQREARAGGREPTAPDALFPIEFAGPEGYHAGPLPGVDPATLAEATAVVQQLLYWLPDDTRLYWLLGELYNAGGDPEAAVAVLDECADARRFNVAAVREHRRVLKEAVAERTAARQAAVAEANRMLPASGRLWTVLGVAGLVFALLMALQLRLALRKGGCRACGE
jgi:tetratricopeptide (TPR) repeat protein